MAMLFKRKTPYEKELAALERKERRFVQKRSEKRESFINQKLGEVVPQKLQSTIDAAFSKAFGLIFEKGTKYIEKTYNKTNLEINYKENEYTDSLRNSRKSIRRFSKKAKAAGSKNILISTAAGVGMGILGIGIPDIPVFTALVLKNIYEIALDYGFEYESEKERIFILWVIEGAVSYGEKAEEINRRIDNFIALNTLSEDCTQSKAISDAAGALSKELLYMKFVQGIPIVGAIGGLYDAVYMKRINEYANLKYSKRQLLRRGEI